MINLSRVWMKLTLLYFRTKLVKHCPVAKFKYSNWEDCQPLFSFFRSEVPLCSCLSFTHSVRQSLRGATLFSVQNVNILFSVLSYFLTFYFFLFSFYPSPLFLYLSVSLPSSFLFLSVFSFNFWYQASYKTYVLKSVPK